MVINLCHPVHWTTKTRLGAVPIVSYRIPAFDPTNLMCLLVPDEIALEDMVTVVAVLDNTVDAVVRPVPATLSPIWMRFISPPVTVIVGDPRVVVTNNEPLQIKSAPIADITLFNVPLKGVVDELGKVPPNETQPSYPKEN